MKLFNRFTFIGFLVLFSGMVFGGQDTILANGARTATITTPAIYKSTEQRVHIIINVSVVPGTDTITPRIEAQDFIGNWYTVLQGAAISTTGVTVLKLGPGIGAITNGASNDYLPDVYRIVIAASASSSFTYYVAINKGI